MTSVQHERSAGRTTRSAEVKKKPLNKPGEAGRMTSVQHERIAGRTTRSAEANKKTPEQTRRGRAHD